MVKAAHPKQDTKSERAKGDSSDESDNSPRSEAPSGPEPLGHVQMHDFATPGGYFSSHSVHFGVPYRSSSRASSSAAASPTGSLNASTTSIDVIPEHGMYITNDHALATPGSLERPMVQRDLSSSSTASTATIVPTTPHSTTRPGMSYRSRSDYPTFPNQNYIALQSQKYPRPHAPPYPLRTRSSNLTVSGSDFDGTTEPGSKTAGSSPAATPGLFDPRISPSRPVPDLSEAHGFYSSPYLHFTQRQAPKETHIADVDVDPISGRKFINEYEIVDELGRGMHGKVKLGRSLQTGEYVAIKIVERYSKRRRLGRLGNAEEKVKREVAILKKARHPNVVALLEVIDDPAKKKVYIVLERVELGEIRWRAEGYREMALIESRRYERESRGMLEDSDAQAENEGILEAARKRRAIIERRRLRALRRQRQYPTQSWSIEFGADTEDDEDNSDFERASRVSTATTDTGASETHQIERRMSRAPAPFTNELDPPSFEPASTGHLSESTATRLSTAAPEVASRDPLQVGSNETSHEFHHVDRPPSRSPSVALSTSSATSHRSRLALHKKKQTSQFFQDLLDDEVHPDLMYVPCMTLEACRVAFRDTVLGLEYLHYQGIIHRDIKPPNLLQTRDHRIKISDFGVSYLGRPSNDDDAEDLSESDAQDFDEAKELAKTVGTAAFYAPELCFTDPNVEAPPVGKAIDVWALGITLFCMLFARTPFVDGEYVVMRRIAEEQIYIPRKRLQPIDTKSNSRPSSHGRMYQLSINNKRAEHELAYEAIDDDLYDLLKRLLIKNPRHRITLEEVKVHPWVVQGISDLTSWLDQNDPSRASHGKRIEVTKEELNEAVVPLNMVGKIHSSIRTSIRKIGGALGIGRSSSTRKRTKSSLATDAPSSSAASSSSAISQDGRRLSLQLHGDESIFSALKASSLAAREGEHPLSQSVTASPEIKEDEQFFNSPVSRSGSPVRTPHKKEGASPATAPSRPSPPKHAQSTMSTAESIKTVRPSDFRSPRAASPPPSPGLPVMPTVLDTPGESGHSDLLGGSARRFLKSLRERSTSGRNNDSRARSSDASLHDDSIPHSEPSVAVSNTLAAGRVDQPEVLRDIPPQPTFAHAEHPKPHKSALPPSRQSSVTSHSSSGRPQTAHARGRKEPLHSGSKRPPISEQSAAAAFSRAEDEMIRRRNFEAFKQDSRPSSAVGLHPPANFLRHGTCPPSPDDNIFLQKQQDTEALGLQTTQRTPSLGISPASFPSYQVPPITSSSSEDHLASSMSQSTSHPSMPSIESSANSSVVPDEGSTMDSTDSGGTLKLDAKTHDDDEGYAGDHAIESEEEYKDSDDSDDDGFLEVTRHRSRREGLTRSESVSNAQLQRRKVRRETGLFSHLEVVAEREQ
ncbi:hypothetical protein LTR04_000413 [Oleoguttula sp. CCFEE 6159]|nr:hypothetical protein LTR04_000413 [Oleoguttula sp. CCFEE 6159]